jgi:predicted nucleic acid-binding protein
VRAVFDTNVLVSALLFENSTPARAFFSASDNGEILLSTALVNEIHRILYHPKFDRYVDDAQRQNNPSMDLLDPTIREKVAEIVLKKLGGV